jgi:uncharacterized RDD family membrane protein YckC
MTGSEALSSREAASYAALSAIPRQARAYQGRRAGIVSRFLAASIDFGVAATTLILGYGAWAATLFILPPREFHFPQPSGWGIFVGFHIVLVVYLMGAWWLTGRSYGQHLMGLRVVNRRSARLNVVVAFLRALLCSVFPVGLFWVAFSRSNRSVQDLIVRTSVIYDWRRNEK